MGIALDTKLHPQQMKRYSGSLIISAAAFLSFEMLYSVSQVYQGEGKDYITQL